MKTTVTFSGVDAMRIILAGMREEFPDIKVNPDTLYDMTATIVPAEDPGMGSELRVTWESKII